MASSDAAIRRGKSPLLPAPAKSGGAGPYTWLIECRSSPLPPQAMPELNRTQLAALVRRHLTHNLFDESGCEPTGTAVYTLADPRDIRLSKYVGQTRAPARRLGQHVQMARLWLPDERPWWIREPGLRPLYSWIRELHRDAGRLPVMVVHAWVETTPAARVAERELILDCLARGQKVFNVEVEILGRQQPLL